MAKKIRDEHGNVYVQKKPFYKKIWFIVLIALFVIGALGNALKGGESSSQTTASTVSSSTTSVESTETETSNTLSSSTNTMASTSSSSSNSSSSSEAPKVSREFKNALGKAGDYLAYSAFSKEGLFEQLKFEGFPDDAARYAVDTIKTDWNEQALKKAKDYLEFSNFSDQGLYDQLIFEKFTEAEVQYAIDHLE